MHRIITATAIAASLGLSINNTNAQTPAEGTAQDAPRNQQLVAAPLKQWVKLHEQKKGDEVYFMRQEHGGSCMDTKRCQLVLFGSNTHGRDWMNTPMIFDVPTAKWIRLYADDDKSTYRQDANKVAVAGEKGDHPWAMHTFGTVAYDASRDEMVVACWPGHMKPGRFSNALEGIWGTGETHPTWTFNLETHKWKALECKPRDFFPYACAWDSDRNVLVGYGGPGIWELGGEPREWTRIEGKVMTAWHNNAVYDSKNKAVIICGSRELINDVIVYRPATKEHVKMPTPGVRPPKDQHNPMAFEPELGKLVMLVDNVDPESPKNKRTGTTETWLYDLATDSWEQIKEASLPFLHGMNYNMEYDPRHRALLVVMGGYRGPTTVYGLRLAE
jgi:hypothetical protein